MTNHRAFRSRSNPFKNRFFLARNILMLALAASLANTRGARAASSALSFDVAAHFSQKSGGARTMSSHVVVKGEMLRMESRAGDQKIVVLWHKPYVYRLLPSTKSGVRYKASTPSPELAGLSSNWPQYMNNPSKLRAALAARGAKKIGTTKIAGEAADIYAAKTWRIGADSQHALHNVKIWLRRKDSLPLQLTGKADAYDITIRWSHYQRNLKLPDALFQVPQGYRVRDMQAPPAM